MSSKIGVLALQGSFLEHITAIEKLGAQPIPIKLPGQLNGISGLIIPGGESTTIGKLIKDYGFITPLKNKIKMGLPVYGTCAGLIVLAKNINNHIQPTLGVMGISVRRNAFGRQLDSFEEDIYIEKFGDVPFRAIFIRAPIIQSVEPNVEVLARLKDGRIVAAEEKNILVTAFHPELTDDLRVHRYFLDKVKIWVQVQKINVSCML